MSVLRWQNIGFAAANNRALELANGRYVLLLNPDVDIVSGTLSGLVARSTRAPRSASRA